MLSQTIKALCRNNSVSVSLGSEGLVTTVVQVVRSLRDKKFGPRTKVALEALFTLVKASGCTYLITAVKSRHSDSCTTLPEMIIIIMSRFPFYYVNVINNILSTEPNLILLSERWQCAPVLLDLLAQYELHLSAERLCARVVGTILNILVKLVGTGTSIGSYR